ncbi:MAG: hypothetical protein Phyf2KO_02480 [Phycisphaerales bacterium]
MKLTLTLTPGAAILTALGLALAGCGESGNDQATTSSSHPAGTHVHADGTTHDDHDDEGHGSEENMDHEDHAHEAVALPATILGEMTLELAQGHGIVEAGKESHLVVKLPYDDNGETIVRAWLGTDDRTLSTVGKGTYAPSHDNYDLHAVAPDPLPENTMWWIEIEKPDGTKVVGSAKPIME